MAKTALTKSGRASARNSQIRDQGRLDFPAWPPISVIGMDVSCDFVCQRDWSDSAACGCRLRSSMANSPPNGHEMN